MSIYCRSYHAAVWCRMVGAYLGLETHWSGFMHWLYPLATAFTLILLMSILILISAGWHRGLAGSEHHRKGIANLSIYSELIALFSSCLSCIKEWFRRYRTVQSLFSALFLILSSMCYTPYVPIRPQRNFFFPCTRWPINRLGRFCKLDGLYCHLGIQCLSILKLGLYFITWIFQKAFALQYRSH